MSLSSQNRIDHDFIEAHATRLLDEITEVAAAEGVSAITIPMTLLSDAICYAQVAEAEAQLDLLYRVLRGNHVHAYRTSNH
jgi:hypothetical protein